MKGNWLTILIVALFTISANTGIEPGEKRGDEAMAQTQWVDSIFNTLSPKEKIGQLFMIRAHSNLGADHIAKVEKLVKDYQVGGLCFFQGTPEKQAELTNKYQKLSKIPLMISMDAEWGLGMRFKEDGVNFPRAMMLGAIQDNRLLYDMGKEIARQMRRLGVHINFAPVVDVNNNPANPVINFRSFGEDRYNVAAKSYMYMKGMQDAKVMACAKHFPGHGDTDVDSHLDLPVIPHNVQRLDSIELFPFKVLAEQGIQSMMVAHLHVPAIDAVPNLPTTLSEPAVKKLLQEEIGFDGLIFTDGLGMKGVTKHYRSGEVEAKAMVAGNDVLLLPQDVAAAYQEINNYLASGKLSQQQIDKSVKKILAAKYQLGLTTPQQLRTYNIRQEINSQQAQVLKKRLTENAMTLVRNDNDIIPLRNLSNQKIASLSLGSKTKTKFQTRLDGYGKIKHFQSEKEVSSYRSKNLLSQLKAYNTVIVSLHDMSNYASKNFGLTKSQINFVNQLNKVTNVVLVVFGNPYSLKHFDEVGCLLEAYDEDPITEDVAAQALFGTFSLNGRLPVTASAKSNFNAGVSTSSLFRMGYDSPESVGLNSSVLNKIDALASEAVATKATPGCVVLVAKDGKVVYNKSFGYHTYNKKRPTRVDDVFDLASVTKILSSTLAVMKLHEQGIVNIYQPMSNYLPELKGSNKENIILQDVMAHRAQLTTWIKFYEETISSKAYPSSTFYKKSSTTGYTIPVTEKLFLKDDHVNKIWEAIKESPMRPKREYKYSDLGFYLIAQMVQRLTGKSLDQYVNDEFYQPLGLSSATYNPWANTSMTRIPPTEEDKYFRRQRIQGYVHDMGAAMLGGVSGHAGLFANAQDVAILMQLLLNNGYYGGQQYLKPETIRTFTSRHPECSRRGTGFDMKELKPEKSQNQCASSSSSSFGHLGFTGTATWADPENNLIYVFLSNRTYPSMRNNKLNREDFRPRIQEVIYEAMR